MKSRRHQHSLRIHGPTLLELVKSLKIYLDQGICRMYKEKFWFHFKSDKTLAIDDRKEQMEGKFLYCWPYDRSLDPPADQWLVPEMAKGVLEWKEKYIPGTTAAFKQWIYEGTVMACIYHGGLLRSPKGKAKLLSYSVWMWLNLQLDDYFEQHCPQDYFSDLVFHLMRLVRRFGERKYSSLPEVMKDPSFERANSLDPDLGEYLILTYHWYEDFYRDFDLTLEKTQYLRVEWQNCFGIMSWCGSSKFSHLKDKTLWKQFRIRNGGTLVSLEILYCYLGLELDPDTRGNMYWMQIHNRCSWLTIMINDLFSFEKEWEEYLATGHVVDNFIFRAMNKPRERKMTANEAVARLMLDHDHMMRDFKRMVDFVRNNPHFGPEDEKARRNFFAGVDVVEEFLIGNIHNHRQPRYSQFRVELKEIKE